MVKIDGMTFRVTDEYGTAGKIADLLATGGVEFSVSVNPKNSHDDEFMYISIGNTASIKTIHTVMQMLVDGLLSENQF